ncbi:MAG TPA: hypothetical protein VES95_08780 [Dermatophilaceae bacterium]|nr:hypothetical protein [Dermatophilaceae bacterium]
MRRVTAAAPAGAVVSGPADGAPAHPVARACSAAGEVALRRRGRVLELVLDGRFAMDTVDTSTEVALAAAALEVCADPSRVLVGGLGLGFTARAVLADRRVGRVDVVELAEPLVAWARAGLVPELADLEGGGRCRLAVADVADVLAGTAAPGSPAGPWDLVLLDVDNGPGFLLREANADLYAVPGLERAAARLAPGGVLAAWSSDLAPDLLAGLREVAGRRGGAVAERRLPVAREGRLLDYALYLLLPAPAPSPAGPRRTPGPRRPA